MKKLLLVILVFCSFNLFAQDGELDSLLNALKSSKSDTVKVNLLLSIAKKYSLTSPESTTDYAIQARELSAKLNYPIGEAKALKQIGIVYYKKSIYAEAISNWLRASEIFDSIKDKEGQNQNMHQKDCGLRTFEA